MFLTSPNETQLQEVGRKNSRASKPSREHKPQQHRQLPAELSSLTDWSMKHPRPWCGAPHPTSTDHAEPTNRRGYILAIATPFRAGSNYGGPGIFPVKRFLNSTADRESMPWLRMHHCAVFVSRPPVSLIDDWYLMDLVSMPGNEDKGTEVPHSVCSHGLSVKCCLYSSQSRDCFDIGW